MSVSVSTSCLSAALLFAKRPRNKGKGTKKAGNAKKTMEHGKRRSMKATLEKTAGASLMTKKKKRARDVEKASKKVAKKHLKKGAMKK